MSAWLSLVTDHDNRVHYTLQTPWFSFVHPCTCSVQFHVLHFSLYSEVCGISLRCCCVKVTFHLSVQLLKQTLASSANWVTQAWNPQQREESLSCPYGEREKDRLLERAWEIGEMFYMPGFKTPMFPLWTDLAAVPSVCTTAGHKQIVSGGWGAWTWWQTRPGVLFLPAKPRL